MNTKHHCGRCDKPFDTQEACLAHEKVCGHYRRVTLTCTDSICIFTHEDSDVLDERVNRRPGSLSWDISVPATFEDVHEAHKKLTQEAEAFLTKVLDALRKAKEDALACGFGKEA